MYQLDNRLFANDEQNTDHTNIISIFGISQDMQENNKYTSGLSENQRSNLESFVALQRPYVSQKALAFLKWNNLEYAYSELILEPSESSPRYANPENISQVVEKETLFKLYPNPAYDYVTIEYRISEKLYNKLRLEIFNSQGKIVFSKQLQGGDNDELIGLSELSPGAYMVSLLGDGVIISTEKLNIKK